MQQVQALLAIRHDRGESVDAFMTKCLYCARLAIRHVEREHFPTLAADAAVAQREQYAAAIKKVQLKYEEEWALSLFVTNLRAEIREPLLKNTSWTTQLQCLNVACSLEQVRWDLSPNHSSQNNRPHATRGAGGRGTGDGPCGLPPRAAAASALDPGKGQEPAQAPAGA